MKISLLYEINLFDNSVNMYSSNSGHTFENRYSQSFGPVLFFALTLFNNDSIGRFNFQSLHSIAADELIYF